jgi:hypothetical protein
MVSGRTRCLAAPLPHGSPRFRMGKWGALVESGVACNHLAGPSATLVEGSFAAARPA